MLKNATKRSALIVSMTFELEFNSKSADETIKNISLHNAVVAFEQSVKIVKELDELSGRSFGKS